MKPYYEDSAVTIYCCDCREILSDLSAIDLTLVDPPYGIQGGRGNGVKTRNKGGYEGIFSAEDDTPEWIKTVSAPVLQKCIEISRAVILTPGNKNCCAYPQPESFGCFYQPAGCGVQTWGWVDSQPIYYYGKPPKRDDGGHRLDCCSHKLTNTTNDCGNGHPCPKPYHAWAKLLVRGSNEGDVVFDPFLGSGTTLRVAKDQGRKGIGVEINEAYAEIAAKRMAQEILPLGDACPKSVIAPTESELQLQE